MDNLESLFSKLAVTKSGNEREKQRIIEDLQSIKDEPGDYLLNRNSYLRK